MEAEIRTVYEYGKIKVEHSVDSRRSPFDGCYWGCKLGERAHGCFTRPIPVCEQIRKLDDLEGIELLCDCLPNTYLIQAPRVLYCDTERGNNLGIV